MRVAGAGAGSSSVSTRQASGTFSLCRRCFLPMPPSLADQIDALLREVSELRQRAPEGGALPFRSLRDELPPHY